MKPLSTTVIRSLTFTDFFHYTKCSITNQQIPERPCPVNGDRHYYQRLSEGFDVLQILTRKLHPTRVCILDQISQNGGRDDYQH